MKYIMATLIFLALAGCNSISPQKVVDHEVLVSIPCKIPAIDKPVFPFTDTASRKDNVFVKTKKALAEIELRKGYESTLEAGIKSCQ